MVQIVSVQKTFAGLGVVAFAIAAIVEGISADTVLPILALAGGVGVGTYHAIKRPGDAGLYAQIESQGKHIVWLEQCLEVERLAHSKTRGRLGRALDRMAEEGIDYEDKEDGDNHNPSEGKG
jgi:hypothetical protein